MSPLRSTVRTGPGASWHGGGAGIALGLWALAVAPGCGPPDAGAGGTYSTSRPEHPAMTAPAAESAPEAEPGGGGTGGLPPGHPPTGGGSTAPAAGSASSSASGEVPGAGGSVDVLGLHFDVPDGWEAQAPSNRMRRAQFLLPHAEGDAHDAVLTVIASGGSLDANIDRWKGQFRGAPEVSQERREAGGFDVVVVRIDGTYMHKSRPMAPGPGDPREGWRVHGAIVDAPGGQLFFKAVGPQATLDRWGEAFEELVASFRPSS